MNTYFAVFFCVNRVNSSTKTGNKFIGRRIKVEDIKFSSLLENTVRSLLQKYHNQIDFLNIHIIKHTQHHDWSVLV